MYNNSWNYISSVIWSKDPIQAFLNIQLNTLDSQSKHFIIKKSSHHHFESFINWQYHTLTSRKDRSNLINLTERNIFSKLGLKRDELPPPPPPLQSSSAVPLSNVQSTMTSPMAKMSTMKSKRFHLDLK